MKKKYQKKWNLRHVLGFHKCIKCIEYSDYGLGGETKIEYSSPFSIIGTRYTRYKCTECGRKFWMPKGEFEEIRANEKFLEYLQKN